MTSQSESNLEGLLSGLTPSHLRETVMTLARQSGRPDEGVPLQVLMDHLQGDLDLGTGREGWSHQLRLKRTIVALVGETPNLKFVEGDA